MNFTGRINAFRVIERLERLNILGGQNNESVKVHIKAYWSVHVIEGIIRNSIDYKINHTPKNLFQQRTLPKVHYHENIFNGTEIVKD